MAMNENVIVLDTYDKAKKWLSEHVHKNFFPRNVTEFRILCSLVDRHPSKSDWKNQVPTSFKISRSPGKGALVMYVRFDGMNKYRIVSWVACAKGKLSKHQEADNNDNKLNGAMRYAVRMQVSNYKKTHHNQTCVLCGTGYQIEVDHYPEHFVDIKERFVKSKLENGKPAPTEFKWHPKKGNFMFRDGNKANDYYDKKWKQAWQRYHKKHASYRYLCSTCNKKTNQSVSKVSPIIDISSLPPIKTSNYQPTSPPTFQPPKLEIVNQPVVKLEIVYEDKK